jgi:hypothetical protein
VISAVYISNKGQRIVLFISAVKVSEVFVFAGHTVRYFHGGFLYLILHIICNKGRLFAGVFLPV